MAWSAQNFEEEYGAPLDDLNADTPTATQRDLRRYCWLGWFGRAAIDSLALVRLERVGSSLMKPEGGSW